MNFIINFLTTPVLDMKQFKFKKSQRDVREEIPAQTNKPTDFSYSLWVA